MIEVVKADITALNADAIVNAANSSLAGGGGVDGAIHRRVGPALAAAAIPLGPCATGDAVITPGFGLRARFVIHAVGPIWTGGTRGSQSCCGEHTSGPFRLRESKERLGLSRSPPFPLELTASRGRWPLKSLSA